MKFIHEHVTKPFECLKCRRSLGRATGDQKEHAPRKDDISICLYCCSITMFNENGTVRELTEKEWIDLAGSPELVNAMDELAKFHAWKKLEYRKSKNMENFDKFFYVKNEEGEYLADYSAPGLPLWSEKKRALEFMDENEARITALQYGLESFNITQEDLDK